MFRRLGVVLPQLPARLDVDGRNDAPTRHKIERAGDLERCADRVAWRQIDDPSESQSRNVLCIDLCQRAEMLLAVCSAWSGPIDARIVIAEPGVICLSRYGGRVAGGKKREGQHDSDDKRTDRSPTWAPLAAIRPLMSRTLGYKGRAGAAFIIALHKQNQTNKPQDQWAVSIVGTHF